MKKIAGALLLSAFIATPALADNTDTFYFGADFGVGKCCNLTNYGGWPGWSNPAVFSIEGGYHFNPVLAVEMGYTTFGDSNGTSPSPFFPYPLTSATLSLSSFNVAFVGNLPLTQQFDLIGKIGLASNSEQYSDASGGYGNYSQSDLMYGLGAEFHVSPQVGLRAMYNNYGKFDNYNPPVKVTSYTLGMVYNFY